jgi:dihydrofolate reductase
MRKLIVTNIVSLDGQYEGPGGNVMALPMDHTFDVHNAERLRAADVLLLGRRTFELFEGFWPRVADDPGATAVNREISRLNGAIQKVVVSDTLATDRQGAWQSTTRIVRRADAHREIAELKRRPGKEILVFGSHLLWNDLLAAGLVDELALMVGNVILGAGTPAFTAPPKVPLTLLDTRRGEGSSNVLLRYAPAGR